MSSPGSVREQDSSVPSSTEETTISHDQPSLVGPIRFAGFWAAIALPFLHTPLLVAGLDSTAKVVAYGSLLALNVLALVVGHGYNQE